MVTAKTFKISTTKIITLDIENTPERIIKDKELKGIHTSNNPSKGTEKELVILLIHQKLMNYIS